MRKLGHIEESCLKAIETNGLEIQRTTPGKVGKIAKSASAATIIKSVFEGQKVTHAAEVTVKRALKELARRNLVRLYYVVETGKSHLCAELIEVKPIPSPINKEALKQQLKDRTERYLLKCSNKYLR